MKSHIQLFYSHTNVLITGGTGLFGKQLMQKLLRTCTDIEGIYLVIRAKKGKKPSERVNEIFEDIVFDVLKKEQPNFLEKIHLLEGDCSELKLGLSESDQDVIINKVNIIFHCAGLVNFNVDLKSGVYANIRSLYEILGLCKKMENLKAMMYVSTAYSYCQLGKIEEIFYNPPIQPTTLMQFVEECDEKVLAAATSGFLQESPNVYCFTKAIAENLLLSEGKDLPTCLFRPSIVTATYTDPFPGWIGNLYGFSGVAIVVGVGAIRVIQYKPDLKIDFVPADYTINSMICGAWETYEKWKNSSGQENFVAPVYNYSGNFSSNLTWREFIQIMFSQYKYKLAKAMWIPVVYNPADDVSYQILRFLLHTVPYYALDSVLYVLGRKQRFVKMGKKLNTLIQSMKYFYTHEFDIANDNVRHLWNRLNETDKKLFPFDLEVLNINEYFANCLVGIKAYVLKESMEKADIEAANKRHKMLERIHYTVVTILGILFVLFLYKLFDYFLQ